MAAIRPSRDLVSMGLPSRPWNLNAPTGLPTKAVVGKASQETTVASVGTSAVGLSGLLNWAPVKSAATAEAVELQRVAELVGRVLQPPQGERIAVDPQDRLAVGPLKLHTVTVEIPTLSSNQRRSCFDAGSS